MKCTRPTPVFCIGTQRNLYSTDWRRGLASGKTQILALGNAKIYQHVGISNAKFWRQGHCPTPTPDARYFVSQWNIGFSFYCSKDLIYRQKVKFFSEGHQIAQKVYLKSIIGCTRNNCIITFNFCISFCYIYR